MENKKVFSLIGIILLIIALVIILGQILPDNTNDPNVISKNGIHWHPELIIYVNGVPQEIPENIGLGSIHMPVHTHDDLPIIHLEFNGLVKEEDIMLAEFFKSWKKDINDFGTIEKMTVNGEENTEFGNYVMQHEDKIELWYEGREN